MVDRFVGECQCLFAFAEDDLDLGAEPGVGAEDRPRIARMLGGHEVGMRALCRLEEIQHREFKDRVVQPLRFHLVNRDLRNERGIL